MSIGAMFGGGFYVIQGGFQLLENTYPEKNWELNGEALASKLPKNEQAKLKKIETMKNRICQVAGIPESQVSIRLQRRGLAELHGHANKAVLAIGLELLEAYQITEVSTKGPVLKLPSLFREFIDNLPEHPDDLKQTIKSMKPQDREHYWSLSKDYAFNLSDEEMQFIIGHEILGHAVSYDSAWNGVYTTVCGIGAYCSALLADAYFPFPGSSLIWQAAFYTVSYIGLQSVLVRRQEKNADLQSLMVKDHVAGGVKFFKRLMALNLLNKYHKHRVGTEPHFYQLFTNSEGDHCGSFHNENVRDRLLRCLQVKQQLFTQAEKQVDLKP